MTKFDYHFLGSRPVRNVIKKRLLLIGHYLNGAKIFNFEHFAIEMHILA